MAILKKRVKEKCFTSINNTILQDKTLTYEAKGLLCELLSRPENWEIHKEQLIRPHCGMTMLNRLFKELKERKYLYIHTVRGIKENGLHCIVDRHWIVTEVPMTEKEFKTYIENLNDRFPYVKGTLSEGNQHLQINNNITNNRKKEIQNKEPSTFDQQLADAFVDRAKQHFKTVRADKASFSEDIRKLREMDGLTEDELTKIFSFLSRPPDYGGFHWFWQIGTPKKLRRRTRDGERKIYECILAEIESNKKPQKHNGEKNGQPRRLDPTYRPPITRETYL